MAYENTVAVKFADVNKSDAFEVAGFAGGLKDSSPTKCRDVYYDWF